MEVMKEMAIMSHLSDCQEMIQYVGQEEKTRMRINFVKMILTDGKPLDHHYTTQELDEIWEKTNEMCEIK